MTAGSGTGVGADAGITSDADDASASASSTALIDATVDRLVSRKGLYKNVGGAFILPPPTYISFVLFSLAVVISHPLTLLSPLYYALICNCV
jgi:hypothetical protein